MMLVVFKNTHLYNHHNHKMGGGQNNASPKRHFFFVSCHSSYFQSISTPNHGQP